MKSNKNKNYVCTGTTNHAEALEIAFDLSKSSFETLIEFFYKPLLKWSHSKSKKNANKNKKIVTKLIPAGELFGAEQYPQLYIEKNPGGYVCTIFIGSSSFRLYSFSVYELLL
ncbi:peptide methionine sulfoxide reductase MsrA [Zychaea mexicana]|uniref:peptide methionine sulfoxide reductase MsrA n=1 Tax=Zychaea mexicana TaxID=64656 RepID=UPI0022FE95D4|nr:peptide methionine sulfoxide reductase MsrA [Zychaea mexicana]KAI9490963.1 peptide methionine sulfoxide reductase MsrA [Zychaea mexicana]